MVSASFPVLNSLDNNRKYLRQKGLPCQLLDILGLSFPLYA